MVICILVFLTKGRTMKIEVVDSCCVTTLIDGVRRENVSSDTLVDAAIFVAQKILKCAVNGDYSGKYELINLLEMIPPTHEECSKDQCETCGETTWTREWEV